MPKSDAKRTTNREHDARRRADQPWRHLYKTARWQGLRRRMLAEHPLCQRCSTDSRPVAASVVHHVERHNGDPIKFWSGPFACLCPDCHDIDEQRIERGGQARVAIGEDGWPI